MKGPKLNTLIKLPAPVFLVVVTTLHFAGLLGSVLLGWFLFSPGVELEADSLSAFSVAPFAAALGLYWLFVSGLRHVHSIMQETQKMELDRQKLEQMKIAQRWKEDLQGSTLSRLMRERKHQSDLIQSISSEVGAYLAEDYSWASRAMRDAHIHPYRESTFFERSEHYAQEKEELGRCVGKFLFEHLLDLSRNNKIQRVYVLIDSGSTIVPVMSWLSRRFLDFQRSDEGAFSEIRQKVRLLTNNLAGVEAYLFPEGREVLETRIIPIHIAPGRPSAQYRATTSPVDDPDKNTHAETYISDLIKGKRKRIGDKGAVHVISIITGNWVGLRRRELDGQITPHPFARGRGHPEFKQMLFDEADEAFVVTPLAKIVKSDMASFNSLLRNLSVIGNRDPNVAYSDETRPEEYREVSPSSRNVRLLTTARESPYVLAGFSGTIAGAMRPQKLESSNWTLRQFPFDPEAYSYREQRELEFPHFYSRNEAFLKLFDAMKLDL